MKARDLVKDIYRLPKLKKKNVECPSAPLFSVISTISGRSVVHLTRVKCFAADFIPLVQSAFSILCSNEEASAASCPYKPQMRMEDKKEVAGKAGSD